MTGLEKPLLRVEKAKEEKRNAEMAKEKMNNPLRGQGNNRKY